MVNEPIIQALPWLLAAGPIAGTALVYLLLPRLWAFLGKGWVQVAIVLVVVVVLLLEVRP